MIFKEAGLAQNWHNYEKSLLQGKEGKKHWGAEVTEEPTLGEQKLCCFYRQMFQKSIQQIIHSVLK